jgi:hypothetical protein
MVTNGAAGSESETDESLERRAAAIAKATGLTVEDVLNRALIWGFLYILFEHDVVG